MANLLINEKHFSPVEVDLIRTEGIKREQKLQFQTKRQVPPYGPWKWFQHFVDFTDRKVLSETRRFVPRSEPQIRPAGFASTGALERLQALTKKAGRDGSLDRNFVMMPQAPGQSNLYNPNLSRLYAHFQTEQNRPATPSSVASSTLSKYCDRRTYPGF